MRISFWHRTNKRFDPEKLWETPFGGAEMQAFHLAKELSKRHSVWVYCNPDKDFDDGQFHIRHYDSTRDADHQIFICKRADDVINPRYQKKFFDKFPEVMILWSGDDAWQKNNEILYDSITLKYLDKIVVNGTWQMQTFIDELFIPEHKLTYIRNAVEPSYYIRDKEKVNPNKFIHASTVYRGAHNFLKIWPKIWPKIKKNVPNAELHIYSKTSLYLQDNRYDDFFSGLFKRLGAMDGVVIHEPITQKQLAKEFLTSYLMLYPNSVFLETACNAALESIAAGCPVITSDAGGLKQTVKDFGYLCKHKPESSKWIDEFCIATLGYVRDRNKRDKVSKDGAEYVLQNDTWRQRARQWEEVFEQCLSKK